MDSLTIFKSNEATKKFIRVQEEAAYEELRLLYKAKIVRAMYLDGKGGVTLPTNPASVVLDSALSDAIASVRQLCTMSPNDVAHDVIDEWEGIDWPAKVEEDEYNVKVYFFNDFSKKD